RSRSPAWRLQRHRGTRATPATGRPVEAPHRRPCAGEDGSENIAMSSAVRANAGSMASGVECETSEKPTLHGVGDDKRHRSDQQYVTVRFRKVTAKNRCDRGSDRTGPHGPAYAVTV